MGKKKKTVAVPKKVCCTNCKFMEFGEKEPGCLHPESIFADQENCKNFYHTYSCERYKEIAKGEKSAQHPVLAHFKDVDDGEESLAYLNELEGKEVDIHLSSGAMYTGKVVGYNLTSITFLRSYGNERMMFPMSEIVSPLVVYDHPPYEGVIKHEDEENN